MAADMSYVLDYYKEGYFTDEDMELFIKVKWITREQYDAVRKEMGKEPSVPPIA